MTNKLTKEQNKRFESILDTVEELARKAGHDGYVVDVIKLKVADELSRQREEIVEEFQYIAFKLDQAIKTITNDN